MLKKLGLVFVVILGLQGIAYIYHVVQAESVRRQQEWDALTPEEQEKLRTQQSEQDSLDSSLSYYGLF